MYTEKILDSQTSARLFLIHFDYIIILHFQLFRRVGIIDASAVEQKAEWRDRYTLWWQKIENENKFNESD